mmetsp:Transcript_10489/g.22164  ORF Transcript_10489/g.22164 Transcript_10489/m.22164 type:complete len:89 (+) Transcript_10489:82-348(+)
MAALGPRWRWLWALAAAVLLLQAPSEAQETPPPQPRPQCSDQKTTCEVYQFCCNCRSPFALRGGFDLSRTGVFVGEGEVLAKGHCECC